MTANETPAALLRRAADRLDETAAETSPEPWATPHVRAVLVPWVALMSVEIAAPLAAWLRSTAVDVRMIDDLNDKVTARAESIGGNGHTFTLRNPYVAHAVAFARSILGETETA